MVYKYLGKTVPKKLTEQIARRKALLRKEKSERNILYSLGIISRPSFSHNRFEILKRDGFKCRYCGIGVEDGAVLHIDHIVSLKKGGKNENSNYITACDKCNLSKHTRSVE